MPGAVRADVHVRADELDAGATRLEIANKGLKKAVQANPHLAEGVNTYDGKLTYRAVAEAQGRPYTPLAQALSA